MNCWNCGKYIEGGGEDHWEVILLERLKGEDRGTHCDVCESCAFGMEFDGTAEIGGQ